MKLEETDYPALYGAADSASLNAQKSYFLALRSYLILLVVAALLSYAYPSNVNAAIGSAALFLATLAILVWLRMHRPDDIWYNGRAVAESVKTRAWRWIMRAEPYSEAASDEQVQKEFLTDLKAILNQNRSLSHALEWTPDLGEAISAKMIEIRRLNWSDRLKFYIDERIDDQSYWYSKKSQLNRRRSKQWFIASIVLHSIAILLLLYRIKQPESSLPIEVVATAASAVLTWVQAKKYNELNSSYALAAHEIVLVKGEAMSIREERHLSEFVIDSEAAFSREHTQWTARKSV